MSPEVARLKVLLHVTALETADDNFPALCIAVAWESVLPRSRVEHAPSDTKTVPGL